MTRLRRCGLVFIVVTTCIFTDNIHDIYPTHRRFKAHSAELQLPCGLVCSRARLRCARARFCWRCRARCVLTCSEMARAGCAWSFAIAGTYRDAVCSERALLPCCCVCCPSAARARRCFFCAIGCTIVSPFESHRQAGGLRPKAGGGCVSAWIVCDAVRGADCRVQCFAAGRAIGGR